MTDPASSLEQPQPDSETGHGEALQGEKETNSQRKLRDVVEAQSREILLLRERLSALGVDPDKKQAPPDEDGDTTTEPQPVMSNSPVQEGRALEVLSGLTGDQTLGLAFPALLRGMTDKTDVCNVRDMCKVIVGDGIYGDWEHLFGSFYEEVVKARESLPSHVLQMETSLPPDWYRDPWYLLYVQWTGTPGQVGEWGTDFDNLRSMLPYIRDHLGFRNICLLPHYESLMADGGYDVSAFETRKSLGGEEAFERFMTEAIGMGLRIATDAVFNHTSTEHEWFQKAVAGDEKLLSYYVQRNGREKVGEWDRNGDIVCRYRDPDGTITERVVVFPDIDRTHGLWAEIHGRTYQFYRGFYPFQVDLNLQNPDVLTEVFRILAREIKHGVLGKRMDAVAHWIKQPGCASEGLPECHAVQGLIKSFLKHINSRCVLMPEVVRDMANVAEYAGKEAVINCSASTSEGDALLSFEMQAALREMTYFQTVAPYWQRLFRIPTLPGESTWINLLEHHDETYMGFFAPEVRVWLAEYIKTHRGAVYKNGMSAGGRIADCLNADAQRIAMAIFLLYVTPGTPLVYAGTEIGAGSNTRHAEEQMVRSHEIFKKLGVYAEQEMCYDPRELQRGPLPRMLFDQAVEQHYLPTEIVRKLNGLRSTCKWMREGCAKPIDSGDVGVVCMGREALDGSERVLCLANLTPLPKSAMVPVGQCTMQLGIAPIWEKWEGKWEGKLVFVDVVSGEKMFVDGGKTLVRFRLEPFAFAAVRAIEIGSLGR